MNGRQEFRIGLLMLNFKGAWRGLWGWNQEILPNLFLGHQVSFSVLKIFQRKKKIFQRS